VIKLGEVGDAYETLLRRKRMIVYHAVTERPMYAGQELIFDAQHPNGVHRRVMEKLKIVHEIYAHPQQYDADKLQHHTAVALRELAMEEVRLQKYPHYPSRMHCLYVTAALREAEEWGEYFASLGRPVYQIVKLQVEGNCFAGNAARCFRGSTDKQENLRLAQAYWENRPEEGKPSVPEMLVDGKIRVLEILREINANLG